MKWLTTVAVSSLLLVSALALAQPRPPAPPMPPGPPGPPPGGPMMGGPGMGPPPGMGGPGMGPGPGMHFGPPGIPPQVAQRLGISPDTVKKVQTMSLDANEQLIGLEADLKRAQLDLERVMLEATPDEGKVMAKLDAIGKAETALRKNRVGLMLKIRKLLGPDTWQKLEAELPAFGPERGFMHGGPGEVRREVRIIRGGEGADHVP